ncbi:MAG: hypothetical protein CMF31_01415 [Kordiimonas sp.]|nr:hypothetical protein [Kordiimonas sp.]
MFNRQNTSPANNQNLLVIVILAVTGSFGALSIDALVPALPEIAREFQTTTLQTQWTISSFLLGFGLGQMLIGPLADRFGRRPTLLWGIALYTITSLCCILVDSIELLTAMRFLQAVGAAAGAVITRAVVRDVYTSDKAAKALSVMLSITLLTPFIAPIIGGLAVTYFHWTLSLWIMAACGTLCLLANGHHLVESLPPDQRHSLHILHIISVYKDIIRSPVFLRHCLTYSFCFAGLFIYIANAAFIIVNTMGYGPESVGYLFAGTSLGASLGAYLSRLLLNRNPVHIVQRLGILSFIIGCICVLILALLETHNIYLFGFSMVFCTIGMGISWPSCTSRAMAPFKKSAGSASALLGGLQFILASVTSLLAARFIQQDFLIMAVAMMICAVMVVIVFYGLRPLADDQAD